ncbi:unnamed protein product, partial [Urochloa humidicola]
WGPPRVPPLACPASHQSRRAAAEPSLIAGFAAPARCRHEPRPPRRSRPAMQPRCRRPRAPPPTMDPPTIGAGDGRSRPAMEFPAPLHRSRRPLPTAGRSQGRGEDNLPPRPPFLPHRHLPQPRLHLPTPDLSSPRPTSTSAISSNSGRGRPVPPHGECRVGVQRIRMWVKEDDRQRFPSSNPWRGGGWAVEETTGREAFLASPRPVRQLLHAR